MKRQNRISSFRQPKLYLGNRKDKKNINLKKYFSAFTPKRVVFVLTIVLLSWWVFISPSFSVKDIIVEGNSLIPADKIISEVPKNQNIFLINSGKIEKNIKKKVPEVYAIQVYKGLPDALKIVVVEYDQSLIWKRGDSNYLIDSEGRIYKDIGADASKFGTLPVVEDLAQMKFDIGQKVVSSGFVAFVNNVNTGMADLANLHPVRYTVQETTFDLNCYTSEGIYIKFDTSRASKKQLEDLKKVMIEKRSEIKEYVDLRVDGWAYYK